MPAAAAHRSSYAIGGHAGKNPFNWLKGADADTWDEVSPLKTPRSAIAVAVHRILLAVLQNAMK